MKSIIKVPRTTKMFHQCIINQKMKTFDALKKVYDLHFKENPSLLNEEEIKRLSPEERSRVNKRIIKYMQRQEEQESPTIELDFKDVRLKTQGNVERRLNFTGLPSRMENRIEWEDGVNIAEIKESTRNHLNKLISTRKSTFSHRKHLLPTNREITLSIGNRPTKSSYKPVSPC